MACDSSSTDPECGPGNGPHCYDHDPACCHCGKPRPECEHPNKLYTGSVYNGPAGRKTFLFYTCPDCKVNLKEEELDGFERPESPTECEGGCRVYSAPPCRDPAKCSCGGEWWKHGCKHSLPPELSMKGDYLRCRCGHFQQTHRPSTEGGCRGMACECDGFKLAPDPEEPPLTPEEHEKAAMCGYCDAGLPMACTCGPDEACGDPCTPVPETPEEHNLGPEGVDCVFDACPRDPDDCDNGCRAAADELTREANEAACQDCLAGVHGPNAHREAPPQPDRRPPYLLAYSVQGHLYEVALPGDATVAALDGRLVITHHLGPVAGICQIAPITSEES